MAYAIITKKIVKLQKVSYNTRLAQKLGRELLPEEMKYTEHEVVRYVCVLRPRMADYEIRMTRDKKSAIFYLESELPYVEHRLKGRDYYVIDLNVDENTRIPAAINIALEPETIGRVSCLSQIN